MQSRHSKLCVFRRAGQYSPSRFLTCHSNRLDPLSNRRSSYRSTGFYVIMQVCVTVGLFHFTALGLFWSPCVRVCSQCASIKRLECSCRQETVSPEQKHTWLQHRLRCGGSSAAVDLHMTCLCFQSCSFVPKVGHS